MAKSFEEDIRASKCRDVDTIVSYSKKVFVPLTRLCRNVCHYCTFAKSPRETAEFFLSREQVLEIARRGRRDGCKEALITLGEKPELRYRQAKEALTVLGHRTTIDYVYEIAELILQETGLLPHINAGALSYEDYSRLRRVSPSMGLMLETSSGRLSERGGPHFGSPDKEPVVRLKSIENAGKAKVPLTTGILIGIGETRDERLSSLQEIKNLHKKYGHIQEIIIQNFMPKAGTLMENAPPTSIDELIWTIKEARAILGPDMNIQAPPNLNRNHIAELIEAGINDFGGISPITPDHVNPECPWPDLNDLATMTNAAGRHLTERLTIYPAFIEANDTWIDDTLLPHVLALSDGGGYAREDNWSPGDANKTPPKLQKEDKRFIPIKSRRDEALASTFAKAKSGEDLSVGEIVELFQARGPAVSEICEFADELRRERNGDAITYVINQNINYTNICKYRCAFCAFSKGKKHEHLRGTPYLMDQREIKSIVNAAWAQGCTEVCMQGGIHPAFTGETYLDICRAVKEEAPDMHIHAFSPLEVFHGAQTLDMPIEKYLMALKSAGLGSLPGTAAEILGDDVRAKICPDKIDSATWVEVVRTAHEVGLKTTSTIMFGHVEGYESWAHHLLTLRGLQKTTGGITEFVPLPFVHMEAPMFLKGAARPGPTFRETLLMHAVSRIALYAEIDNIQVSWPKLGPEGVKPCLQSGANDLGGTLISESISKSAGAGFGQVLTIERMNEIANSIGRTIAQRNTVYDPVYRAAAE